MPDAVILAGCRTAIGTAYKGSLVQTSAYDLADAVVSGAIRRSGVSAADVDDIVLGEGLYGGGVVARYVAVRSDLAHIPGAAVNRHCSAGLTAVQLGAADIRAGMSDAVVVGGTNSQSTSPRVRWRTPGTDEWIDPWIAPSHPPTEDAPNIDMSLTVGWNTAVQCDVSREEMDAWAARSQQRAVAAIDDGRFVDEIEPMEITDRDGVRRMWDLDEHPRRGTTIEKLASLPPLHPEIDGFSITAGNAAGINDGAAALFLASSTFAAERGIEPLGVVRSWASVGLPPAQTGIAPTLAIPAALKKAGLSIEDVDLVEINEAFASMAVACTRVLGFDEAIVNVSGSGCSLGHPVAATGARMLVTLTHELRRRGGGIAVASMCAGGGMGTAVVIEVASA